MTSSNAGIRISNAGKRRGNVNAAGYRFGVKDAVDEFASIYNLRVNIIWKDRKPEAGGPMPQWYLYKC